MAGACADEMSIGNALAYRRLGITAVLREGSRPEIFDVARTDVDGDSGMARCRRQFDGPFVCVSGRTCKARSRQ
jgi:hypothetical protein